MSNYVLPKLQSTTKYYQIMTTIFYQNKLYVTPHMACFANHTYVTRDGSPRWCVNYSAFIRDSKDGT